MELASLTPKRDAVKAASTSRSTRQAESSNTPQPDHDLEIRLAKLLTETLNRLSSLKESVSHTKLHVEGKEGSLRREILDHESYLASKRQADFKNTYSDAETSMMKTNLDKLRNRLKHHLASIPNNPAATITIHDTVNPRDTISKNTTEDQVLTREGSQEGFITRLSSIDQDLPQLPLEYDEAHEHNACALLQNQTLDTLRPPAKRKYSRLSTASEISQSPPNQPSMSPTKTLKVISRRLPDAEWERTTSVCQSGSCGEKGPLERSTSNSNIQSMASTNQSRARITPKYSALSRLPQQLRGPRRSWQLALQHQQEPNSSTAPSVHLPQHRCAQGMGQPPLNEFPLNSDSRLQSLQTATAQRAIPQNVLTGVDNQAGRNTLLFAPQRQESSQSTYSYGTRSNASAPVFLPETRVCIQPVGCSQVGQFYRSSNMHPSDTYHATTTQNTCGAGRRGSQMASIDTKVVIIKARTVSDLELMVTTLNVQMQEGFILMRIERNGDIVIQSRAVQNLVNCVQERLAPFTFSVLARRNNYVVLSAE